MSGLSALNMEPSPIPVEELDEYDRFLSETDKWVKHAIEHFDVAIQATEMIRNREKALASRNEELEKELKELKVRYGSLVEDFEEKVQEIFEVQEKIAEQYSD
jgi:phenylalanyl-tRNA synthetase alpha subunit